MKLYHGTSKTNAKLIVKNGFRLPESGEGFFLGRAFYFKHSAESAKQYGDTIIEVDLKVKPCSASKMEGIGTFEQWAEIECDSGNENCCAMDDDCFQKYGEFAEDERLNRLREGCVAVDDGTQVAIFDEKLIKKLKPRIVKK